MMNNYSFTDNNFAVFVTNIHKDVIQQDLKYFMEKAGRVIFIKLFNKEDTNKNYAYVYYTCLSDAIRAIEYLDQALVFGVRMFISIHKDNEYIKLPFPMRNSRNNHNNTHSNDKQMGKMEKMEDSFEGSQGTPDPVDSKYNNNFPKLENNKRNSKNPRFDRGE